MSINSDDFRARIERAKATPIESEARRRGLRLKKASTSEFVGACPQCGGTDRFGINLKKQVWRCRQCAPDGGDTIEFVRLLDGVDFLTAVETLVGKSRATVRRPVAVELVEKRAETSPLWPVIWREAGPIADTLGERYLREDRKTRIVDLLPDAIRVVRFHPRLWHVETKRRVSGIVALFRDIRTDEPCGINRTFLSDEAKKLGKAKMLGRAKDAAIKLTPDEEVSQGLTVGEGLETCLAALALGFCPMWCCGSSSAIASFPVLPGIESLTILGENADGGANARAARACADKWIEAGEEVVLADVDPLFGEDMSDVLRGVAL
jgi:hypothetical protein